MRQHRRAGGLSPPPPLRGGRHRGGDSRAQCVGGGGGGAAPPLGRGDQPGLVRAGPCQGAGNSTRRRGRGAAKPMQKTPCSLTSPPTTMTSDRRHAAVLPPDPEGFGEPHFGQLRSGLVRRFDESTMCKSMNSYMCR